MDWSDLGAKVLPFLPTVTALVGAFVGAVVGPQIARKAALDTAKFNLEGQRSLAAAAHEREEQAANRQERRDLLEPLLTAARDHVLDVQNAVYSGTPEPPQPRAILHEDVRWSVVPSTRFQAALAHYRHAKASLSLALISEWDQRDEHGVPPPKLTDPLRRLTTTVLDLHGAAETYIREGPDTPPA